MSYDPGRNYISDLMCGKHEIVVKTDSVHICCLRFDSVMHNMIT